MSTGYSKLRLLSKKSRSIDFADLLTSNINSTTFPIDHHQTTKTEKSSTTSPPTPNHGRNKSTTAHEEISTIHEHHDQYQADDHDDHSSSTTRKSTDTSVGAMHWIKNSSVISPAAAPTSSSTHRFRLERQRSTTSTPKRGLKSAVKRAFSMRRSSSSSSSVPSHEKYCRIHDQCVAVLLETTFDDEYEDDDDNAPAAVDDHETKGNNIPTAKTMRSPPPPEKEKYGSRVKILSACKRLLGFH